MEIGGKRIGHRYTVTLTKGRDGPVVEVIGAGDTWGDVEDVIENFEKTSAAKRHLAVDVPLEFTFPDRSKDGGDDLSRKITADLGDSEHFLLVLDREPNAGLERRSGESQMLTVGKLVEHLRTFDQNALVCGFETKTGDWRPVPSNLLWWLVRDAKTERENLRINPKRFREGKMEEDIDGMLKHVEDGDVLVGI